MSISLIINNTGRFWVGDHDPQKSEIPVSGSIEEYDFYINSVTNILFQNINSLVDNLEWKQVGANLSNLNVSRSWEPVSLIFNQPRVPSDQFDTFVSLSVNLNNSASIPSTLDVLVNAGDGFQSISTLENNSSIVSSITLSYSFIVPKGSSYKLVPSESGIVTLKKLYELSL